MKKQVYQSTLVQAVRDGLGFNPTIDQTTAIDKLADFVLNQNQDQIFLLSGYAGTGKTSLIASFVNALSLAKIKTILLAPTGRAAKVLSNYSSKQAFTIHRRIYFSKEQAEGDFFVLGTNTLTDTLFVVDEASMIAIDSGVDGGFSNRNLLDDLIEYVYSAENCKLVFVGDRGQLPPIGLEISPALDADYLQKNYSMQVIESPLNEVVRQKELSGILEVAVGLRDFSLEIPRLAYNKSDARSISGLDLQEELESAVTKYGRDEVMVVTRSNKRANLFNEQIRRRILWQEEDLNAGDVIMVTKNNYFWLNPKSEAGFIANGELLEIKKITKREEIYGFEFANVVARMIDYPNMEDIEVKIILDAIRVDAPSLPREKMRELFYRIVEEEYPLERNKAIRNRKVMQNQYFQALQVKFGYAVTCHKAQGGQWEAVFVDQGYFTEDMWDRSYMRWLYTAVTRARKQLYLVNFSAHFVGSDE